MKKLHFRCDRNFTKEQAAALFQSIGWFSGEYPAQLARALRQAHRVVTAWEGDRMVGLCSTLSDGCMTVYVNYMLVLPELQGKGIGKTLLRMTLAPYSRGPYRRFLLLSDKPAVGFYEKFGFTADDSSLPMMLVRR